MSLLRRQCRNIQATKNYDAVRRDDATFFRQRPEHRRPGAEIAQRAMYADQRRTPADLEIGHVVSVDGEGLHGGLGGWVGERRTRSGSPNHFIASAGCLRTDSTAVIPGGASGRQLPT